MLLLGGLQVAAAAARPLAGQAAARAAAAVHHAPGAAVPRHHLEQVGADLQKRDTIPFIWSFLQTCSVIVSETRTIISKNKLIFEKMTSFASGDLNFNPT